MSMHPMICILSFALECVCLRMSTLSSLQVIFILRPLCLCPLHVQFPLVGHVSLVLIQFGEQLAEYGLVRPKHVANDVILI
jgi:hypothetical protein